MSKCPCGSGKTLAKCCGPVLSDECPAVTAEALMRSRYTAFVVTDLEHLKRSTHPDNHGDFDEDSVRQWSEEADWEGLEILGTQDGCEGDETGVVEFVASFTMEGEAQQHHEIATFSRMDDHWYFVDGQSPRATTVVRDGPKIGRNDPCPCGSGRKFKKCCG